MTEIGQQLGRIAESGKKTFGNIVQKVKAKIAEMDQPKSSTQPSWGASTNDTYDPAAYERRAYQGQTQSQPQTPQTARTQSAQAAAYYDPNLHDDDAQPITLQGYDTAPAKPPTRSIADMTNGSDTVTSTSTIRPPGIPNPPIDGGKLGLLPKRPVSLLRPPTDQQQHATGAIEHSQSQASLQASEDSGDGGLEYAENPFDERDAHKGGK